MILMLRCDPVLDPFKTNDDVEVILLNLTQLRFGFKYAKGPRAPQR